jgi:DNA-binding transcriptional MocR family regulator
MENQTLKPNRPWSKVYRHIIYAVPTFSNPSAKTMSLRRREALVRLARTYDALIVTDDVYDFLQFPAKASATPEQAETMKVNTVPRIVDVDRILEGGAERDGADGFGNSMSNGSFSKILGPGVRTGWAEGTEKFAYGLSQVGSSRSGGCPSQLVATFISELLASGALQKHIHTVLQPAYAERYQRMTAAIEEYLYPLGVTMTTPSPTGPDSQINSDTDIAGGYFIWLTLPASQDARDVADICQNEEELTVAYGDVFEVYGDEEAVTFPRGVRLCFAWESEEALVEGIVRLARVVKEMRNGSFSRSNKGRNDISVQNFAQA